MMRFVGLIGVLLAAPVDAQEALPEAVLKQLKDATVFIRATSVTPPGALARVTGSGFLVQRKGTAGIIATNAHVIMPGDLLASPIDVVFYSGTAAHTSVMASYVGRDYEHDLAFLKVELDGLPHPLNVASTAALRETLPVFILGFPFGQALTLDAGDPAVTISKGTISSFRKNPAGELSLIQISGDVNPGNSGGPMVDESGNLVGVAVAAVRGTRIGMAIPRDIVQAALTGQVKGVRFERVSGEDRRAHFQATVIVLDPLEKLENLALLTVPAVEVKRKTPLPEGTTREPISRKMKEHKLERQKLRVTGDVALVAKAADSVRYLYQVRYADAAGKPLYTAPRELIVEPADTASSNRRRPSDQSVNSRPAEADSGAATSKPDATAEEPDGDDWLVNPDQQRKRKALATGTPVETGTALLGEKQTVVDAAITKLQLAAGNLLSDLVWSEKADFVYALGRDGVLRKIAVPTFVEERQFLINQECTWLGRSAEGLAVAVSGLQELWVFDEATLEVKARIPVARVRRGATSPALALVFTTSEQRDRQLTVVDLRKQQIVGTITIVDVNAPPNAPKTVYQGSLPLSDFGSVTIVPGGRYLFCMNSGSLHRFRINGRELVYEERGPRLRDYPSACFSDDSRYVAMPVQEGNAPPAGHPALRAGVYIYKVTDLQVPVMALETEGWWRTLAFDKAAGRICVATTGQQFVTYTPQGTQEKVYSIAAPGGEGNGRQLLVHPEGSRLLCLTDSGLSWIELPR